MWWIQTTGYHVAGLIWLIVIAVIFVIAIIALSTAGAAAGSARRTRLLVRDHEAHHVATGVGANDTIVANSVDPTPGGIPTAFVAPEEGKPTIIEHESEPADPSLGDSMRILHERYARGEITRDEYLQARADMMAITR